MVGTKSCGCWNSGRLSACGNSGLFFSTRPSPSKLCVFIRDERVLLVLGYCDHFNEILTCQLSVHKMVGKFKKLQNKL